MNITINNKEIECRLNIKSCLELERKLGANPVNTILLVSEGLLPKLSDMLVIFYYALKDYNKGLKLDDVYTMFDDFCANGAGLIDFVNEVITPLLREAGLLAKGKEAEEKN